MRPAYYRTIGFAANDAVSGPKPEAEAPTAPLDEGELAAAEQRIAQIPPTRRMRPSLTEQPKR
jgi:hypothetical protein